MFGFRKKEDLPKVADDDITAIADGTMIDITNVSDPVFAQKMMGDGVAFQYEGDSVTLCSPANGKLTVMYPTGHAYGVTMNNGTELLVHIGIDTVEANGKGFKTMKKQGDPVKAGEPVVKVDLALLRQKYDMSVMLIVTDAAGQKLSFVSPGNVKKGQSILRHNA